MSSRREDGLRFFGKGFTLVECLVVVAILGVLISILLPAVQYVRESARQAECQSHLRQIAIAMHSHQSAHGVIPSGGWGSNWVGEAAKGFGPKQPGGWIYSLLPYIEQQSLFQMSSGSSPTVQRTNAARMLQSSVPVFLCPTRRTGGVSRYSGALPLKNCDPVEMAAKNDFAINQAVSGIKSEWTFLDIRDGLSQTIFSGEKLLRRSSPSGPGDEDAMLVGMDDDNHRSAAIELGRDFSTGVSTGGLGFGSAHARGCNFVFFDGSTKSLSFGIDQTTLRMLGDPSDGKTVEVP